jgi:hypothetical protein
MDLVNLIKTKPLHQRDARDILHLSRSTLYSFLLFNDILSYKLRDEKIKNLKPKFIVSEFLDNFDHFNVLFAISSGIFLKIVAILMYNII